MAELLRLGRSHHPNRVEGRSTHPVDIERALREDRVRDPAKRELQRKSLAHLHCQPEWEARLDFGPGLNGARRDFLQWLQRAFHERLPDRLRTVHGEVDAVTPGQWWRCEVMAGCHMAPGPPPGARFSTVSLPSPSGVPGTVSRL